MKKSDLIAAIAATGITKAQATTILDALPLIASVQLATGQPFQMAGLVKLTPQDKPARLGRNPATGEPVQIAAKRVIKAKSLLKAA